ncbi:MAG: carboxylating nicotinate-nucleotide diphosphorylase [Elusimicrobiota bacterium]|nr:carboxylating nicotinate-nucleotide diphosphorylase [Elusimicrobiota bacterium]
MKLDLKRIKPLLKTAIAEDLGDGDITSTNMFSPTERISAKIIANQKCIISGLPVVREIFKLLDKRCIWRAKYRDGDVVKKARTVATVTGFARAILSGERTALNFLSRLTGIATLTGEFVKKLKNTDIKIYDTRKTTPGLRLLEKYAVSCGGGFNHRFGLYDMVIIKDNHIKICKKEKLPIVEIIASVKRKIPYGTKLEIEINDLRDIKFALQGAVDIIMLDNMDLKTLRRAIKIIRAIKKDVIIEVSGNVNLKNITKIAKLDIDRISIGKITHSAPAVDFSLEVI